MARIISIQKSLFKLILKHHYYVLLGTLIHPFQYSILVQCISSCDISSNSLIFVTIIILPRNDIPLQCPLVQFPTSPHSPFHNFNGIQPHLESQGGFIPTSQGLSTHFCVTSLIKVTNYSVAPTQYITIDLHTSKCNRSSKLLVYSTSML